jgi:pyruvate/2-oxoglutarate dehydrogenase complex dihydrolipoamide dehydrogenase (E3) component
MSRHFDAIIIGAGQAGPSLAGRLTGAGTTVTLVERKLFGGTCVNTGCTPTKTLIASAYAAHVARRGADYGVMLDAPLRIDVAHVQARADAVSANARAGDEAIHGILDIMNASVPYDVLQRAVPIHPTVSGLIPTMLGEMTIAD